MKHAILSSLGLAIALCPAAAFAQSYGGYAPPPAQPVYVQPAPGYGQPQPVYVVQQPVMRQRVVPYAGGPIPPGATIQERSNPGLLAGGASMFAIAYLPSLMTAIFCHGPGGCESHGLPWLAVPVAGPLIALAFPQPEYASPFLVLDAMLQAGGVAMIVAGIVVHQRYVVYNEYARREQPRGPSWSLFPSAPGAHGGVTLSVTNF